MLGLKANTGAEAIHQTALPLHRSFQVISGIKLHTRLRGEYLHHSPALGVGNASSERRSAPVAVQHVVVVIALRICDLLVWRVDPLANTRGLPEIERE